MRPARSGVDALFSTWKGVLFFCFRRKYHRTELYNQLYLLQQTCHTMNACFGFRAVRLLAPSIIYSSVTTMCSSHLVLPSQKWPLVQRWLQAITSPGPERSICPVDSDHVGTSLCVVSAQALCALVQQCFRSESHAKVAVVAVRHIWLSVWVPPVPSRAPGGVPASQNPKPPKGSHPHL